MKKQTKRRQRKHSEVWWVVKLPVEPSMFAQDTCAFSETTGLMMAKTKNELNDFNNHRQKIVKVRITEL